MRTSIPTRFPPLTLPPSHVKRHPSKLKLRYLPALLTACCRTNFVSDLFCEATLEPDIPYLQSIFKAEMAIESSRASNRTFLLEARNFRVRSSSIESNIKSNTEAFSSRTIEHARSKGHLCFKVRNDIAGDNPRSALKFLSTSSPAPHVLQFWPSCWNDVTTPWLNCTYKTRMRPARQKRDNIIITHIYQKAYLATGYEPRIADIPSRDRKPNYIYIK